MLRQATPVAVSGSGAVSASRSIYCGFSLRETAGATAVVRIFDNPSAASGTVLEEISLAANESAREFYPGGVAAATGIYVQVTGTVVGSVRVG